MISLSVMKTRVAIIIPNWNGKDSLGDCIESLSMQANSPEIVVVENGSTDGSLEFLQTSYPKITILPQAKNLGFAGGVNVGLQYAIEKKYAYAALFNNDAVANKDWLKYLVKELDENTDVGIATCKLLRNDKKHIDSTGDLYTSWGLPFPRGRDELDNGQYDKRALVFGASGGASLYRVSMLKRVSLFDEDFFAYYEDIDISFRAQLAGWKVAYQPKAIAYHQVGATSGKIKGFAAYQSLKNLPWVYWKNVPIAIALPMFPKIFFAYWGIFVSNILKGNVVAALKGTLVCHLLLPKKLFFERYEIQKTKVVSNEYIRSLIHKGPPPNATKLWKIRSVFVRQK